MTAEEILQYECPALYALTATMNYYVASARLELSASVLGVFYDKAVAYLAAHRYSLNTVQNSAVGAGAGRITSKTEGRLSVSFGGIDSATDDYGLTNYGIQLKGIIDKCGLVASSSSTFAVNCLMDN